MATQLLDDRFNGIPSANPGNDSVDWNLAMIAALRAGDDQRAAAKVADRARQHCRWRLPPTGIGAHGGNDTG
jgi:hypothetical protein